MDAYKRDRNLAGVIAILLFGFFIILIVAGCSYGTYNATGSYPDQDNSRNCEPRKG